MKNDLGSLNNNLTSRDITPKPTLEALIGSNPVPFHKTPKAIMPLLTEL